MIITRYICRQILQATAAITLVLMVVVVLGRMLNYLAQASQGQLDPDLLALVLTYRLPDFLQLMASAFELLPNHSQRLATIASSRLVNQQTIAV